MRIKIDFDVSNGVYLPINYNYLLASVIYEFLRISDPEYAHFLHEDGYSIGNKHFKLFTFSQLMAQKRRISGDQINFYSTVTWYVSSPEEAFLANFASTLVAQKNIGLGSQELRIIDIYIPKTPRFYPRMKFRCLSPITISTKRERDGKLVMHYCLPEEADFSELVRQNLIRKYELIYQRQPKEDSFTMSFDAEYMNRRNNRITRLINYKGVDIRGVLCPFEATGSPELMYVGYECGFGDKNSAGFGMVDV